MTRPSADVLDIAVIGGGIGGLAAAAFLARAGFSSTVYEQAAELTEVGAGLVVAPNVARLLRRLGVLDAFRARAVQLEVGWEFRRWEDGTILSAEDLATSCERLYGEHTYTAHRADLLDVIRSAVPDGAIRLGRRCTEVSLADNRPIVRFEDGEVIRPDVMIGADGIHSVVRPLVAEAQPAAYSGLCAFRALVPAAKAPPFALRRAQTLWIGPGHHLVHYPVSAGEQVNVVAFAPAGDYSVESWSATATVEEFLREFDGWDARLVELLRAAESPGRWALLDRAPLSRWSAGPVTLLGDAAHPMFPFFAQGAAQAVEDAAMVVLCLAEDPSDPARALARYESHRIARTARLQEASHARVYLNHLPDGPEQEARDRAFTQDDPLVANGWIYEYDPELAAVAAAAAYAQVTGRVGIASVHQGPGVTNTLTTLTHAVRERQPVLVLAGETGRGRRVNQTTDLGAFAAAAGARVERVNDAASTVAVITRALATAERERLPVVVGIPVDVQEDEAAWNEPPPPRPTPRAAGPAPRTSSWPQTSSKPASARWCWPVAAPYSRMRGPAWKTSATGSADCSRPHSSRTASSRGIPSASASAVASPPSSSRGSSRTRISSSPSAPPSTSGPRCMGGSSTADP